MREAILQSVVFLVLAVLVLFAAAGRVDIAPFWAYLAVVAAASAAGLLLIDPDLARERMRPGGKRPMLLYLVGLLPFVHWGIAGLDRGRLHWSDTVPPMVEAAALGLFALALVVVIWAMHVNRFFSSVARIQSERGHRVIDTGPYRFIRHPGYAAAIVMALTSGVALGSWFAAAFGAACIPLLLRRAVNEDRLLRAELAGYQDYASRVPSRLIPGIW